MTQTNPNLSPHAWEERYQKSDTPWDLSGPTPEFQLLLSDKKLFFPGFQVLIPGAGRGHDAIAMAKAEQEVSAVDFSETALNSLLAKAAEEKVTVTCFREDFFALPKQSYHKERYDTLLEYTFFCAIDPGLRAAYANAAAALLKPGGFLVGLFFPTDGRADGPPFAMTRKEVETLFSPHFELEIREPQQSIKPRAGKEFLGIFRRKN